MAIPDRGFLPEDSRTINPVYPDGRTGVNASPDVNGLKSLERQLALMGRQPYYPGAVGAIMPRDTAAALGGTSADVNQKHLECRPGELLFTLRPRSAGGVGMAQSRTKTYDLQRTRVGLPVFSSLAFMPDIHPGNPTRTQAALQDLVDFVGIVPEVATSSDRNGNFLATTGGLMSVIANSSYVTAGDLIEAYIPTPDELRAGTGPADAKADRPVAQFRPVKQSTLVARHYGNYTDAMKGLRDKAVALLKLQAPAVAAAAAAGDPRPGTGPIDPTTPAEAFWLANIKATLRIVAFHLGTHRGVWAPAGGGGTYVGRAQGLAAVPLNYTTAATPAAAGSYQALPATTDADFDEFVCDYLATMPHIMSGEEFAASYGAAILSLEHMNADANRFIVGKAITSAKPGYQFDLIVGRHGF